MCEDAEEAVTKLSHRINKLLNEMAPIRTIQVRTRYAPWISEVTKVKMRERDLAQMNASITQSVNDSSKYKSLRYTLNNERKFEKKI